VTHEELRDAYGRAELGELWRLARETMESPRPRSAFSVRVPDAATAAALGFVLRKEVGFPARRQLSLVKLNEHLLAGPHGRPLVEVLHAVHGRPVERGAERADAFVARDPVETSLWKALDEHGLAREPWAQRWVEEVRRYGRVPAAEVPATARRAAEILATLPRVTTRHALAGTGLDRGRPLARLVLRGLALSLGVEAPATAAQERALWERAGVAVHGLGAPPVVHAAEAGGTVAVCRSPRLVEEAIAAGVRHSLVCVGDRLTGEVREVLRGRDVVVHADFDRAGLELVDEVVAATGGRRWRMDAADYRAAVAGLIEAGVDLPALTAAPAGDSELVGAMTSAGLVVEEEHVLETLLADLIRWSA
jgi:hypothetical protein